MIHFFSPVGPLFNDLTKSGPASFIPQLAKAIRKPRIYHFLQLFMSDSLLSLGYG